MSQKFCQKLNPGLEASEAIWAAISGRLYRGHVSDSLGCQFIWCSMIHWAFWHFFIEISQKLRQCRPKNWILQGGSMGGSENTIWVKYFISHHILLIFVLMFICLRSQNPFLKVSWKSDHRCSIKWPFCAKLNYGGASVTMPTYLYICLFFNCQMKDNPDKSIFWKSEHVNLFRSTVVPILSNFRMLPLKCTGYESALTPLHFNDDILCDTKLAAMVKRFGLKSSNFLSGYYQWLSKW